MPEAMDPAIKLFGRTIPFPEVHPLPGDGNPDGGEKDLCKEVSNAEVKDSTLSEEMEPRDPNCSSGLDNDNELDHQTPTKDDKSTADPKPEQDESETDASGKEKPLKKPDKILPCPRCRSFDTKFCYYNNYNVNQPRHFCKNCQRYWTAGGTMRNVPVGAGRRKNKHSSHYRQLTMASDFPDPTHHQPLSTAPSDTTKPMKANGTVLKFGPEAPLCESMASALNLREKKRNSELSSMASGEDDQETSVTASNHAENGFTENGFTESNIGVAPMHPLQYYPWAFPMVAGPAFCAPVVPFPFMPAAFWGCMNAPWIGANGMMPPPSSASNNGGSRNGFPNLGKHSRDANPHSEEKTEKSLWVPKTLRIDDPDEAAKSSIWATLGIKPDEGCIFKAFRSKAERKVPSSQALHANPAALSRSQSFQEST